MVKVLDSRFPGVAEQVEMVDVATPATFERYTGNWRASFEGWQPTPANLTIEMPKTLPGLDSLLPGRPVGGPRRRPALRSDDGTAGDAAHLPQGRAKVQDVAAVVATAGGAGGGAEAREAEL